MPANWPHGVPPLGPADIKAAVERVEPHVRPVALLAADAGPFDRAALYLAAESAQITGSFKVREAVNLAAYYLEQRSMPEAGVVIADPRGGNAASACAWAARETETAATVFAGPGIARSAVDGLCALGAQVQVVEGDDAVVAEAARRFADREGALLSHPYDNPLVVAGAATLAAEINAAIGSEIDTVVVPVVGAALFAGTCAALEHTGIRIVPVELHGRRRLARALETAACPDDGGRGFGDCGVTPMAVELARGMDCVPVAVTAEEVDRTRVVLWRQRRLAVEWPAAMALAAVQAGVYVPDMYERVVVVLTGGNIDPADLIEA
jgi:threonine dehydratase